MAAYICLHCEKPEEDCEKENTCKEKQRLVKFNDLLFLYRQARELLEETAARNMADENPWDTAEAIDEWLKETAPICYALPKGIYADSSD